MGGIETHCQELLPRIAQSAADIAIEVIARKPYVTGPQAVYRGVRVTPLPSPRGRSSEAIVSTFLGILHARRRGAKIVHIHAVGPALLAPFARLLNMRVVFTHHGADYERSKWGPIARAMLRLGEWTGMMSANAVIAVAPSLAESLKTRFPSRVGIIRYLPNGTPDPDKSGNSRAILAQLGVEAHDFVLAVGRLVPEKGFDLLIDAMKEARPDQALLIVGGADHESDYSRRLLARGDRHVIFAGVQPRQVLHRLYQNALLFVLPSSHEGLPIAALEAGFLGCPMILSDIQPNLDLGLASRNYFRSGDKTALAERLAEPSETYAVSARRFDPFDWNAIAAGTLGVYRSVLAGTVEPESACAQ